MSFKRFFLRPFELIDLRLAGARYAASAISALEAILLPIVLHPALYTEVEKNRQLLTFLPIALLGASLGYIKIYFNEKENNLESDLISGSIISAFSVAILVFLLSKSELFSLSVFLFILCTSLERVIFVRNKLILASLYKLSISCSIIFLFSINYIADINKITVELYFLCVIFGCIIWLIVIQISVYDIYNSIKRINIGNIFNYRFLIYEGFYLNVATYVLVLFFISDRYIISQFFPKYNYYYALSFSISQIPIILLNTIAYSFLYKMGSNNTKIDVTEYKKYRKVSILVFIFSYMLGSIAGYAYMSAILIDIQMMYIYFIMSFFMGLYFALSAATGLALYLDLSRIGLAILLACLAANLALSPLLFWFGWQVEFYVLKSGAILALSAVLLDRIILSRLDRRVL